MARKWVGNVMGRKQMYNMKGRRRKMKGPEEEDDDDDNRIMSNERDFCAIHPFFSSSV